MIVVSGTQDKVLRAFEQSNLDQKRWKRIQRLKSRLTPCLYTLMIGLQMALIFLLSAKLLD